MYLDLFNNERRIAIPKFYRITFLALLQLRQYQESSASNIE